MAIIPDIVIQGPPSWFLTLFLLSTDPKKNIVILNLPVCITLMPFTTLFKCLSPQYNIIISLIKSKCNSYTQNGGNLHSKTINPNLKLELIPI